MLTNKTTYSGYTALTAQNLVMDSGAFFKDFDYTTDTYATAVAAGKLLGATRGGGSFNAMPTLRAIEVDGVKGRSKMMANDGWEISLTANMLEISSDLMALMLPGSTTTIGAGTVDHEKIEGTNYIEDGDFVGNITFVGKISGNLKPVIIQVFNAMCTTGLPLTTADKSESVIPVTFMGHYDPTSVDVPPFAVYYPKLPAAAPTAVVLAVGSAEPVGAVVNVAIPAEGATDTTGAVTGWVTGSADNIKFTVTDAASTSSTITINAAAYVSGADYTIGAATPLTIVVTTARTGYRNTVRTFTVSVTAAP
jgi:hypothetical protein